MTTTTKEKSVPDSATDPWQPEDPDELPDPRALLAYWKAANDSPAGQRRLVADGWCLWRFARDLVTALEATVPHRSPEQQAVLDALARLPKVPRSEFEACKTEKGGYRFTRDRLSTWGVPWPPPAGWRQAIEAPE